MNDWKQLLSIGVDAVSFAIGLAVGCVVTFVCAAAGMAAAFVWQLDAPLREGMAG